MKLTKEQAEGLAKRFRHFDAERAAPLFHQDQTGTNMVGKKTYPAVLMVNSVQWHYNRDYRPKAKTKAPPGPRPGLTDDPKLEESCHVIVEGEADAVALLSVGQQGVFCTGGTDYARQHGPLFKGRNIYLLFDGDDPGRTGARAFALAALDAGAQRVHVAQLPEGEDPESWLDKFETPERAQAELQALLAKAESLDANELRKARDEQDESDGFEARHIYTAQDGDNLLVTIWEPGWEKTRLAVFGPLTFGDDVNAAPPYPGGEEDEPAPQGEQGELGASIARGWRVMDGLRLADRKLVYRPAGDDGIGELIRMGSMIVPPTPDNATQDPRLLWLDLVEYFRRWLFAGEADYHVLTAYTLACWHLEDGQFECAPFLRIHGSSGSGKTRAVELLHLVSNVGLYGALTPANLHRVVNELGEFTLFWDEFNPENMSRNEARELITAMNMSQKRASRMLRMVPGKQKGDDMRAKAFRLFGPKVFCGYLVTEDDGFTRRTINLNMGAHRGKVPLEMRFVQLPQEAKDEARELRARLLAWRAQMLERGKANPLGDAAHDLLVKESGLVSVAEAWWPLFYVLPEGMDDVRTILLERAGAGEQHVEENRHAKVEAYVLETLVELIRQGTYLLAEGVPAVTLEDLVQAVEPYQGMSLNQVSSVLRRELGLGVQRFRLRGRSGNEVTRKRAVAMEGANRRQVIALGRKLDVDVTDEELKGQPDDGSESGGM